MLSRKLTISTFLSLVIALISLWSFWSGSGQSSSTPSPVPQPSDGSVKVMKVVDGDTIEVMIDGVQINVRLIGINTPETVDPRRPVQCFGKEASAETKSLLSDKWVILEKDVSEVDKYDRLLRYVYLPMPDGSKLMINDYLVRSGFAQVSSYPPDIKYQDRFLVAETEAKTHNLGLWAKCPIQKTSGS